MTTTGKPKETNMNIPIVSDRLQGVDCYLCEEETPHSHTRPTTGKYTANALKTADAISDWLNDSVNGPLVQLTTEQFDAFCEVWGDQYHSNLSNLQALISRETHDAELLEAAKNFVAWVDDVWGSAALSDKTLGEYEQAKAAIEKAEQVVKGAMG